MTRMMFKLVEGSKTHAEVLYLKHLFGSPDEVAAMETAIRVQAELGRLLDAHVQVRLWGGPPFGALRWFAANRTDGCPAERAVDGCGGAGDA